jgi:hypothetical protein
VTLAHVVWEAFLGDTSLRAKTCPRHRGLFHRLGVNASPAHDAQVPNQILWLVVEDLEGINFSFFPVICSAFILSGFVVPKSYLPALFHVAFASCLKVRRLRPSSFVDVVSPEARGVYLRCLFAN